MIIFYIFAEKKPPPGPLGLGKHEAEAQSCAGQAYRGRQKHTRIHMGSAPSRGMRVNSGWDPERTLGDSPGQWHSLSRRKKESHSLKRQGAGKEGMAGLG